MKLSVCIWSSWGMFERHFSSFTFFVQKSICVATCFCFYRKEIMKILTKTKQPVPYPKNEDEGAGKTCKIGGVH